MKIKKKKKNVFETLQEIRINKQTAAHKANSGLRMTYTNSKAQEAKNKMLEENAQLQRIYEETMRKVKVLQAMRKTPLGERIYAGHAWDEAINNALTSATVDSQRIWRVEELLEAGADLAALNSSVAILKRYVTPDHKAWLSKPAEERSVDIVAECVKTTLLGEALWADEDTAFDLRLFPAIRIVTYKAQPARPRLQLCLGRSPGNLCWVEPAMLAAQVEQVYSLCVQTGIPFMTDMPQMQIHNYFFDNMPQDS